MMSSMALFIPYRGAKVKRNFKPVEIKGGYMEELKLQIKEFSKKRDWDQFHSPKNLAMALIVEVAELLEHFQWTKEEESFKLPHKKLREVKDEIGDSMIYLIRLSDKLGIDPIKAAHDKLNKNKKKYPVKLVKGKSKKYTEY